MIIIYIPTRIYIFLRISVVYNLLSVRVFFNFFNSTLKNTNAQNYTQIEYEEVMKFIIIFSFF